MNRRAFLRFLGLVPIVGPVVVKTLAAAPVEAAPIIPLAPMEPFVSMEEILRLDAASAVPLLAARLRDAGDSWTRAEYL